jgi:hypothetical protein
MFITSKGKLKTGQLFLALLILISFSSCVHTPSEEEKEVIAVVQQFFDAMAARDSAAAHAVLMPEGRYFSIHEEGSEVFIGGQTHLEFCKGLASSENDFLERMWDQKVLIHGRIAVLWTPYDFHRNGEFSHCGVDAFSLLKTSEGWKIAGTVFTREKTGCEESPLGPPE